MSTQFWLQREVASNLTAVGTVLTSQSTSWTIQIGLLFWDIFLGALFWDTFWRHFFGTPFGILFFGTFFVDTFLGQSHFSLRPGQLRLACHGCGNIQNIDVDENNFELLLNYFQKY